MKRLSLLMGSWLGTKTTLSTLPLACSTPLGSSKM